MVQKKTVLWEVDAQADFMLPGGKLYVPGAEKIIPRIARLVKAANETGTLIASSGDAHIQNDPEFQKFPPHCIAGTSGAEIIPEGLAKGFRTLRNDASRKLPKDVLNFPQVIFEKQTLDVFDNPKAAALVECLPSDAEYIVFGVATEYCVRFAAKGLLDRRRRVSIVRDAIEALSPEAARQTLDELQSQGARLITTDEALAQLHATAAQSL
ncbi:MAG TPA: isochorismatase family cysteine hydrolase [Candidatus Acidoferrales bacterium]|nr:isochorismatase family cysteine hydrolase [Candidatus Acidoferrales bacterium]